uniref:sodium/hydrogen exchanger 8-like isoform X1 n=2 Tax=Styela clava TaxID=7725 RepID=UPI00193932A4|nr:sodium/hydrogen exchanger 8-like isoform X1 [Styela clava]
MIRKLSLLLVLFLCISCQALEDAPKKTNVDSLPQEIKSTASDNFTTTTTAISTTTEDEGKKQVEEAISNIQTGQEAQKEEQSSSMKIFFILIVLALCILLTHLLIKFKFHLLPDSVAVVFLGAAIGGVVRMMQKAGVGNWLDAEMLSPNTFFLLLLPPIIFEAGYSLHKGNFFQNIGSILVFAVIGTTISAMFVGGGIYLMGVAGIAYNLTLLDSFAFGSLVSAVDPVATIAIFNALNVDPVLNMLVFGESILNDAVSIVLTNTFQALANETEDDTSSRFAHAITDFLRMMFGSALLGVLLGLISALLMKWVDLRKTPSLEMGMMLIFSYIPYGLAEGLKLSAGFSGIMAILFAGIVMSHYTHHNLSLVTQINIQQTLRTLAYMAETSVFAYLGMAIFSFQHNFQPAFVIWSIVLLLLARALNIYPLSWILNHFRDTKITKRMQFIMWFSGLRGAICYVLSLHLELDSDEKRQVIITTSLIIVLFTLLLLGGATFPVVRCLKVQDLKTVGLGLTMSKTEELGKAIESDHISELTEEEYEEKYISARPELKGFAYFDAKYLMPFFTRRITKMELIRNRTQMQQLTNKWYEEVRGRPSASEDEEETEI